MNSRFAKSLVGGLLACAVALPVSISAQSAPKKASKADAPSRWDLFAGYSFLKASGTDPRGVNFDAVPAGVIGSAAYYFNKNWGLEGIGDAHRLSGESKPQEADFAGGSAGLIYRYPVQKWTPFVHVLGGGERVGSYNSLAAWGPVFTVGGGVDYSINRRISIRLAQVDYQYTKVNLYLNKPVSDTSFNIARVSAGVVFHAGEIAPPTPVGVACAANPSSVYAGDPVTVTASGSNLNPKSSVVYTWAGDGVSGKDTTATVATGAQAPGVYTVKCGVKEGKPGKEGLKPWQVAESTASYTVKPFEPPTVSCSANPSTIKAGEKATITAQAVSPQNRPLTYSYKTASGAVAGSGATAEYDSTGFAPGTADVVCSVSDDKGHTVSSNAVVNVVAPPAPPARVAALCSISFEKDKARPTRVDNEAKACLDEVALNLLKTPDSKAVVVGQASAKEKAAIKGKKNAIDPAAQRAVNTKNYLVAEKGVDASRVAVATSTTDGQKVENYFVPSGASFANEVSGTTPVTENVKPVARKPLAKKAAKKAVKK